MDKIYNAENITVIGIIEGIRIVLRDERIRKTEKTEEF